MSSIYGWWSPKIIYPTNLVEDQRIASQGLPVTSGKIAGFQKMAEVGGNGIKTVPSIYQSDQLLIIIDGAPQWQDSSLAALARTHGAAQALAEGFVRYGRSVIEKMRGPFAFSLIASENHYALLAIDRLGIRPLAFKISDDLLVFGSQLDQITAHPGVKAEIDPQAIFNYLYFHMVPSPGAVYNGISKLQPGEFVEFKNGQATRDFYWQLPYKDSGLSKKELLTQLHFQLKQSVAGCLPDRQTGTFLSGGLDSSTVTGIYQEITDYPVEAFSIGFDADGYDEMEYARATARHFNVNLHEYYVTPADVLKAIPLIAQTYDEPFGNASAIPAFYCAKFAQEQGMQQLLAGDGGDEIFAGNARYAKQKMFDLYRHIPGIGKSLLEPLAFHLPPLGKVKSYIDQAKIAMPDRMETYNFLHRSPLMEIFSADFIKQINPEMSLQNLRHTYNRSSSDDLVKKMLFLDGKFTLADNDLRKVNRMCELAGIDVQYPMLQENLVDFAASIPSKWLMQGFELRSFYRQGMKNFLAKETLAKSKQGFGLPFGVWMSNNQELKQFAEANLAGIEKRSFMNPAYIHNLIQLHQKGHASYYGVMIWLLIMLEQWLGSHKVDIAL
ncbi:Asparagine synthase (Glutamine-hydrolysing) [Candidatus Methylobacter favarea]|uniref:asparagine synthase (glutamine-hydrolyzing) n=1 Tax=Candidatus Methylobacter favarea TaxID=2707345 RepID=A0A8S0WRH8_9GAMM|nr:asparagine synthase-related protein [Candidatus Methylobacter favarea]CAA9892061.1 Asparagine synthase (Glutamine-hydrolysing) [Candidatus Methylobacter favarea]